MDEAANGWRTLWNPSEHPHPEVLGPYINEWAPPEGFQCPDYTLTGKAVLRQLKANADSAASCDDWLPAALVLLPEQWFDLLAHMWNVMIRDGCDLPAAFLHVKCVLIPKPDDPSGGLRPIGIASAVWRACNAVMVKRVSDWYLT